MPVMTKPRLMALAPINPVRMLTIGAGLLLLSAATLAYAGPPSDAVDTSMEKAGDVIDAADTAMDAKDVMKAADDGPAIMKDHAKDEAKKIAQEKAMDMAKDDAMDVAGDVAGDVLPAPGEIIMEKKAVPVMTDKSMMETAPADSMPASSMPASTPAATVSVACPAGTTAQPDGTCMITGDWAGE